MSTTTYSPSINTPNVLLNNVSSSRDLVNQSFSICPTTSNLTRINQFVQKLTNTVGSGIVYQPSYATITANSYSAVVCSAKSFYGGVLLPDGRVVFIPQSSSNVGIFYTSNNTYTNAVSIGTQYNGGCLLPDGRVAICPYSPTTWALYNPVNNTVAQYGTVPANSQFVSCVLGADGNAYTIGVGTGYIGIFNPTTNTASIFPTGLNPQGNKGVLMPDGRIIWGTGNQSYLVVWNPATWTASTTPNMGSQRLGAGSWVPQGYSIFFPMDTGGSNICTYNASTSTFSNLMSGWSANFLYTSSRVLPSGLVVLVPFWANYIGFFNPATNTYSTLTPAVSLGATNRSLFEHGVLLPDGRIIFIPQASTTIGILNTGVPASADFCLHPIYNRC